MGDFPHGSQAKSGSGSNLPDSLPFGFPAKIEIEQSLRQTIAAELLNCSKCGETIRAGDKSQNHNPRECRSGHLICAFCWYNYKLYFCPISTCQDPYPWIGGIGLPVVDDLWSPAINQKAGELARMQTTDLTDYEIISAITDMMTCFYCRKNTTESGVFYKNYEEGKLLCHECIIKLYYRPWKLNPTPERCILPFSLTKDIFATRLQALVRKWTYQEYHSKNRMKNFGRGIPRHRMF